MPPSILQHRRTHNLLLLAKLLNQRDAATSPFTLLLDSLEQTARPVVSEYIRRAKSAGNGIVFVAFETLRRPKGVDDFVAAWKDDSSGNAGWRGDVVKAIARGADAGKRKTLLIIDSLNPLCASTSSSSPSPIPLSALLSSFLSPNTSLLAVYHTDIPLPASPQPYTPYPLTLLRYLATTLLTTHNFSHILAAHAARSRSLVAPTFGLAEDREGVLQGLLSHGNSGGGGSDDQQGLVLELEHRRKSGRGVREWYFLPSASSSSSSSPPSGARAKKGIQLLEDHPSYRRITTVEQGPQDASDAGAVSTTFEMGLTDRQRRDREGVVLPYFDAQKGGDAGGEGGRILYDFGSEDDFDEEEDEI